MAVLTSDDFNRANGTIDVGNSDWTQDFGTLSVVSNELRGPSGAESVWYNTGGTVPDDQYAQFMLATISGSDQKGICVRHTGSDFVALMSSYFSFEIQWYNGGSYTAIGGNPGDYEPLDGDVHKLEVSGSAYQSYLNGTPTTSGSNASAPSSGDPGIYMYQNNDTVDDFEAGSLATIFQVGPCPLFRTVRTV